MEIGIDLVSIERMRAFVEKFGDKGKARFLSDSEMIMAKSPQSIAGIWAAKEAVSKALKCGISKELTFRDIEIFKLDSGAPSIRLSSRVQETFKIQSTSLSITHDSGFAVAAVIILKED
ncbi:MULTISPECIES: holo-ACP synthase [Helicobacter]|uniref:Holo-[acyl-carrier-protein] synthase n=1 Tax=Helicobacter ibis TaxID=2962633 RepID=A0ABT4VE41_9HELI|nr:MULTISPECIES: holo-ACP synthase [Helicobacter]MDA3966410.1 holo-ACP synthase [Helicobacter sp. WB40]MDA3968975.1 holo-ACP synthase [Helicobacter ibis]